VRVQESCRHGRKMLTFAPLRLLTKMPAQLPSAANPSVYSGTLVYDKAHKGRRYGGFFARQK
jgi:hypothetical protein